MGTSNFKLKAPVSRKSGLLKYLLLFALVLAIMIGGYFFVQKRNSANQQAEQKRNDEAQVTSSKQELKPDDNKGLPSDSTTTTTDKVPVAPNTTLSIASFNQSNGQVEASATITGAGSDGVCVFSYTNPDDKPATQQVNSSNGKCSSKIPEVQFSKLGTWKLTVIFYLNNNKSEASQDVTIN